MQNSQITALNLTAFEEAFDAEKINAVAMNAATSNGLVEAARDYSLSRRSRNDFSISLEQGEITNQEKSGRCWMFAAMNTMRFHVMHTLNLKDFELSQPYLFFYDKLEKSNYFLENILDTLEEPLGSRLLDFLLQAPIGDGGQWDMLCNLVRKYGVVPKSVCPETRNSSNSRDMDRYVTEKLREDACILRKKHESGTGLEELREVKIQMMSEIYRILCICLGKPPKTFDFEYRDKDDVFHRDCGLTPRDFYEKYIGWNLDDYVSLINAPTEDKPYGRCYTVKFLGNVKEGNIVRYLNLETDELKRAAIAQLQDGQPVWFGCDMGKRTDRNGHMDLELLGMESLLGTKFTMTKAERLSYGQSLMTHAMVFQGVNLDENGRPNRWRVENSWGKDAGDKGYFVMADDWFSEYVYQVVVHKKYLSQAQLDAYNAEPAVLAPWDPMGSLA